MCRRPPNRKSRRPKKQVCARSVRWDIPQVWWPCRYRREKALTQAVFRSGGADHRLCGPRVFRRVRGAVAQQRVPSVRPTTDPKRTADRKTGDPRYQPGCQPESGEEKLEKARWESVRYLFRAIGVPPRAFRSEFRNGSGHPFLRTVRPALLDSKPDIFNFFLPSRLVKPLHVMARLGRITSPCSSLRWRGGLGEGWSGERPDSSRGRE